MNNLKDNKYIFFFLNFYKKNKLIVFMALIIIILLTTILIVNNKNSKDETKYYLSLVGSTVILDVGEKYEELGFVAYDSNNNNLNQEVIIKNNVDTKKPGEYTVVYRLRDKILYRTVIVKKKNDEDNNDNENIDIPPDEPVKQELNIKLNGDSKIYVLKNTNYKELGAEAYDNYDGNITNKIIITGTVKLNQPGTYKINYSITNSKGITKSISRDVIVYDINYTFNKNCTNSNCKISFIFNDEYYKNIVLPSKITSTERIVNYTITNNGNYNFYIYDKFGNMITKSVNVTEIDISKPSASCSLYLYDDSSKIVVNASDNSGIKGYKYSYGNNTTNILTSNTYTYTLKVDEASVIVYDNNDNQISVKCNVIDNSTKYQRSYQYKSGVYKYWLYIPPNISKRVNKVPLVIFMHGRGECSSDGSGVNKYGLGKYIKNGKDYEFIMAAPQLLSSSCTDFEPDKVMQLVESLKNEYPIDPNRIIITGFSMGGNGTYQTIKKYPNYFAGAMPVATATDFHENFLKTTIWAIHGKDDQKVKWSREKIAMDKVISLNPNSKYTLLEGRGHMICDEVYANNSVIEWFMTQRLK